MAAYAMPVPAPATVAPRMTCHRLSVRKMREAKPTAMISEPMISAVRGADPMAYLDEILNVITISA
ncbi:hypothetical protein ACQP2E_24505 [Actinoplanes sp. CA-015351]|uniref:hypothetical protein n=1 Tax=Actinoplanes sp. CA-015351 TaxID=3239897 RepID=UPI003D97D2FD